MSKFIQEKPIGYTDGYRQEKLDLTPIAVPLGMKKPESLNDMINRIIGNRFRDLQLDNETETFDESDDFDCDDDFDPSSPWEEQFMPDGQSVGFLDQNRYQKPQIFERRLDEREVTIHNSSTNSGSRSSEDNSISDNS